MITTALDYLGVREYISTLGLHQERPVHENTLYVPRGLRPPAELMPEDPAANLMTPIWTVLYCQQISRCYATGYQGTWFLWPATTECMQLVFAVLIPGLQLHLQCIKRPPTEAFSHVTCIDATDVVSEKIEQSLCS